MASRRNLKKDIHFITSELMVECYVNYLLLPNINEESFDALIAKVAHINNEYLSRVNHPNGTKEHKLIKSYYKTLIGDFNKEVAAFYGDLEKLEA